MCDWGDYLKCLDIVAEPANKAYTMGSKLFLNLNIYLNHSHPYLNPSFVVLDDIIQSVYAHFVFKPFSPFYESFNEQLELSRSNGILSYEDFALKWKIPDNGPMVLTLYDLRLGFLAWGIMLVVSSYTFLLELLFVWFKRRWSQYNKKADV